MYSHLKIVLDILLKIPYTMSEIKEEDFKKTLYGDKKMPEFFRKHLEENKLSTEYMSMEEYKRSAIAAYVDYVLAYK